MKEQLLDANFPKTVEGRVYHLGVKMGEVANRIITVGPYSRARKIAKLLAVIPPPFVLESERGFLTITGLYDGVPISIVAIGMGAPNADFFVREVRECVIGDIIIVRLGSCGGLREYLPVGSIVVPNASVAITRNYDYDFAGPIGAPNEHAYRISKSVSADAELHSMLVKTLESVQALQRLNVRVYGDVVNASADSFYSSQGRQTSFPDHNAELIKSMLQRVEGLGTLEMETFHILHLAASWSNYHSSLTSTSRNDMPINEPQAQDTPISHPPTKVIANEENDVPIPALNIPITQSCIRAASVQMVFASRTSQDFITPELVVQIEEWTGKAALEALSQLGSDIDDALSPEYAVWKVR